MSTPEPVADRTAVYRTLRALLASALGILPLCELFRDTGWLVDAWLAMVIVIAPALLLRMRRWPSALQVWPGIVLLVPWLTARYVHQHALFGFIPLGASWHDVGTLMSDLHATTRDGVAPVHTTIAIKLTLCAIVGLLAALIDLLAVVGRHGALAGVPLLIIYTVAGAVTRHPVSWVLFCGSAAAFVLLLSIDAKGLVRDWGRLIPRPGVTRSGPILAVSGQRIAIAAIAVAVLLPFVAPSQPSNLIANALHSSGSGVGNFGAGGSGSTIDPFVALKGQLQRSKPKKLATVAITAPPGTKARPFYLRVNVLSDYVGKGWAAASHEPTTSLESADLSQSIPPAFTDVPTARFTAQISVSGMRGNPAIFAAPEDITGLDGAQWSVRDQLVLDTGLHDGSTYLERVSQPNPGVSELDAAPDRYGPQFARWLRLPTLPGSVNSLVSQVVGHRTGPYAKARAISDFFTDPDNGFTYSLTTAQGDSGNDLVDFLTNRTGYCQQYAAAMAVMLRKAGVPARVVLGYTHAAAGRDGTFTVTTQDAHSWVEAYFIGVGWIPFDPTPLAGIHGGSTTALAWAPHEKAADEPADPTPPATAPSLDRPRPTMLPQLPGGGAEAGPAAPVDGGHPLLWAALGVLVVLFALVLIPAGARVRRRRRRLWAGRRGDPVALWAELADTAVDFGYQWTPARSPRQVARWLHGPAGGAAASLDRLAASLERHRYAAPDSHDEAGGAVLLHDLAAVRRQLRSRRDWRTRLRALLWAPSLRWRWRRPRRR
jgi:transglutaminase-like putative cysteine protease